jgi:hypothetical protein
MKPANSAPIYASIYAELAELCRSHGYALAVHGSLARDFDLVCIPWADHVSEPPAVVTAITNKFALRLLDLPHRPAIKPWSREVYTLIFTWGETAIDLSFTPRIASPAPIE